MNGQKKLLDKICQRVSLQNEWVRRAFLKVPRHQFTHSDNPYSKNPADAYEDIPVPLLFEGKMPISSSTAPSLMAHMLERLDSGPGDEILEIGTASGYNAALLAEIAGDKGRVTTIEYEKEIAQRAKKLLAGYHQVEVVHGDGAIGVSGSTFNRIIVTCAATRISDNWLKQLKEGGKALIPYTKGGITSLLLLTRTGNGYACQYAGPCGFMRIKGVLFDNEEDTLIIKGIKEKIERLNVSPLPENLDIHDFFDFLFYSSFLEENLRLVFEEAGLSSPDYEKYCFYQFKISSGIIYFNKQNVFYSSTENLNEFQAAVNKFISQKGNPPYLPPIVADDTPPVLKLEKGNWVGYKFT